MTYKHKLTEREFSCLHKIGYTKFFNSDYAGLAASDDVMDSHIINVTVPNTRTEIFSATVPADKVEILQELNITKLLQNGQAVKEVVIEVEVEPSTAGWPAGGYLSAGEYSFLTTAGVQPRQFGIVPALEAGSNIRIFATAIQGATADLSAELRVLRIGE